MSALTASLPLACCAFAAAMLAAPAAAQSPGGERLLLERQQTQDELVLKIRQAQELARPGVSAGQREQIEQRHAGQRERQRQLHADQDRRALGAPASGPTPRDDAVLRMDEAAREGAAQLDRYRGEALLER